MLFGILSIAQLLRVIKRFEVMVAGHAIPVAVSVIACVVLAGLSVWLWHLLALGAAGLSPTIPSAPPATSARRWRRTSPVPSARSSSPSPTGHRSGVSSDPSGRSLRRTAPDA
ncbi:hypothetical protein CKO23_21445 [Thiocystis violacea]|nr:hypothetical protein [Thiocystis violacea]